MTRENKLALVVGFGLILFVGILISDHFSAARSQDAADLRSGRLIDPLEEDRHQNPVLLEVPGAREAIEAERTSRLRSGPLAANTVTMDNGPDNGSDRREQSTQSRSDVQPDNAEARDAARNNDRIVMGRPASTRQEERNATFHMVRSGETLTVISRQYYGTGDLARALAEYNDIADPNSVRVNHRLRIPPAEVLRGERTSSEAGQESRQPEPSYITYTIKSGESLSGIAQEKLGSARRWREIYELNRDVISDPDSVPSGTEIRLPRE